MLGVSAEKAEVFRGLSDRSRPRAFPRSYLSVFAAKAVHQISNAHLKTKVIGGARAINIDGFPWRALEWFFDPEPHLLYRDRSDVLAESKYIGDGLLGYSHTNECRLSMVKCVPLARRRWFNTRCKRPMEMERNNEARVRATLHPRHAG